METTSKKVNVIGITLKNKEDYDNLMEKHSVQSSGFFSVGLDFKELFQGYPAADQYPCLVEYYVDRNPFLFPYSGQLIKLMEAGYHIHIYSEDAG